MIILATDSGIERTGYAFFHKEEHTYALKQYGCVTTKKSWKLEDRLKKIYEDFKLLFEAYHPDRLIIEQLFFNTNQKTIVSIAQSQGVLLLLSAQYHMHIEFLTPIQIKSILTGYGRSDKKNVQKMVQLLLPLDNTPKLDDVFDAIACGLAYCQVTHELNKI